MFVRALRRLVSQHTFLAMAAASCLLLIGCGGADSAGDAAANGDSQNGDETSAADAGTATAGTKAKRKAAMAKVPPTVFEVAQVWDLRTIPRLEVVDSYTQEVAGLNYRAKADVATAISFYETLYKNAGWKPSQAMGERVTTENSDQMGFEKDGYIAYLYAVADEEAPGEVNISLSTYPNVDAREIPRPEGVDEKHLGQMGVLLVTDATVEDLATPTHELVAGAGWTELSAMPTPGPNMVMSNYVRNGVGLTVYIGADRDNTGKETGKTMVSYSVRVMSNDVPIPPGAKKIELRDPIPELECVAATGMDETVAFYQEAYGKVGYEPMEEASGVGAEKSSLLFQTASGTSPTKQIVLVELTATEDGTEVHLQPLSDDVDPAQLAATETDVPEPLEEAPAEVAADELVEDLAASEFDAEEMEEADDGAKHPAVVRTFGEYDGNSIKAVAFSPDGKMIGTGGFSFAAYDVANGEKLAGPDPFSDTNTVAYSPDGKFVATGLSDGSLIIWDVEAEEELVSFEGGDYSIESVEFSPDGKILAVADTDGDMSLLDVEKQELIDTHTVHEGMFNGMAFSPDGKRIATARERVFIWDVESGEKLAEFKEPEGAIIGDIAFSPDGKTLAVGIFDTNVELWDVASGERKFLLEDHDGPVAAVAFSPDGKLLASGCWNFDVVLWDAASGERLRVLSGHGQSVNDLDFSPDGTRLATGADDGLVRLWDVQAALTHPEAEQPVGDLADIGAESGLEAEGFEGDDPAADFDEEMPEEENEVDGLPLPPGHESTSSIGSQFAKMVHSSVRGNVMEVMAFYLEELVERGYQPDEGTDFDEKQAVLNFTHDEGPLVVTLEKFGADVRIKMEVKRSGVAKEAGILPKEGKALLIVGNLAESAATITVGDVTLKAVAGEGSNEPDGPRTDLEPGSYTVTVTLEGESPVEEKLEVGKDETWGVMVLPSGPAVLQLF